MDTFDVLANHNTDEVQQQSNIGCTKDINQTKQLSTLNAEVEVINTEKIHGNKMEINQRETKQQMSTQKGICESFATQLSKDKGATLHSKDK
ncbi:hypothetical protein KY284_032976 [Solanum tuberosum]|nr:hypothetical protein KY284_032976 [Solanum tuberosum]